MTSKNINNISEIDLNQFLLNLDDDMSAWPEWKKKPESSPVRHISSDFLPLKRSLTLDRNANASKKGNKKP